MNKFISFFTAAALCLFSATAAFAVTPVPCTNAGPPTELLPNYATGYFTVTNTNPTTQVYSAADAVMVAWTDAGFVAWQAQSGNCVYTFDTLVNMYAAVQNAAINNWPAASSYVIVSGSADVQLTNPIGVVEVNLSASSKTIKLPNMGTSRSPPVGSKVTIINRNATPANVFAVTDSAGNTIVSALPPNTYVDITTTQFGGPGLSASWQASVRFGIGTTLGVQPLNTGMGGTGITTISPGAFLYGGNNPYNALSTGQITGLVLGNGASAPSAYGGGVCTAQFIRVLSAAGVPTCASVSLTADVSGTLPVANGGTGTTTAAGVNALLGSGVINVTVTGIDFSTVSEKLITVPLPTGVTRWAFQQGRLYNASTSLAGSFIQLWQLAGGTGTAMSAATAVTVTSSGPNTTASMQQNIVGSPGTYWDYASFYIRVSTGIGSPATADFTASLVPLD